MPARMGAKLAKNDRPSDVVHNHGYRQANHATERR
jgi:hypothetical protein